MNFVFGIILGIFVGAVIFYILGQRKLQATKHKLQEARQALEESEVLNQQNNAQIQELQAVQQIQIQELEREYQDRIRQLQAEREAAIQENRIQAEQYENQVQQLTQVLEAKQAFGESEIEEDFMLGGEAESSEEFAEIDSLLDLLSDVEDEPETPAILTVSVPEVKQPAATERTDLAKEIMNLGDSGDVTAIYQLVEYTYHTDSQIRALTALSLGKIAEAASMRSEIRKLIPILGKLSRDSEPSVRQFSTIALGKIKSINVIPFLKIARRDTDSDVVKSASAALSKFKNYRVISPQKNLPKNARPIEIS